MQRKQVFRQSNDGQMNPSAFRFANEHCSRKKFKQKAATTNEAQKNPQFVFSNDYEINSIRNF